MEKEKWQVEDEEYDEDNPNYEDFQDFDFGDEVSLPDLGEEESENDSYWFI